MSTMTRPASGPSSLSRFGWTLRDAGIITGRDLAHWRLRPGGVLLGWTFPILLVLMFGGLFGGAMAVPDGGDYYEFLMPGMFVMAMFFGIEGTMIAVTTDASKGVTDRFRSLPMDSAAVLLGRCAADMLNSVVGLAFMIAAGLVLGWRWHEGLGPALVAVALLLLLRFGLLWVGMALGLLAGRPELVVSVQILVWPVGFLSNVFVDPTTMPSWLGTIAEWNPLSTTVSAIRDLFGNPSDDSGTWIADNAIPMAVVWPVLLVAIFLPLATRIFRRLGS